MSPEQFANEFGPEFTDPTPYGPPAQPVKTGLTPRGKAAIAIAATVIAGGTLIGWQQYASQQAHNDLQAKKLALQEQQLQIEQLKAMREANSAAVKTQKAADSVRQKQIDTCVQDNKGLVGKQLGATYRSVLEDCQAQYPDTLAAGQDIQEAASAHTANSGDGVNDFVLLGGGALAIGLVLMAKKGSRREPEHPQYPPHYRPY